MNGGTRKGAGAHLRTALSVLLTLLLTTMVPAQTNIRNNGTITNNGTANVNGYFENFKNATGGTFNNTGTYTIGSYFSNNNTGGTDGTMSITAGTVTVTGNYTNDNGSTTVNGTGILILNGTTNSNATPVLFSVSSGTVRYQGAAQNVLAATYGTLRLAGSGNKTMDGSVTVNTGFDLNAGTLIVGANTLDIKAATLTSTSGTLSAASGTVSYTLAGTQQVFPATYGTLTLSGAFAKTAQGDITVNTTLNNPSGTTLAMGAHGLTAGVSADLSDGVNAGAITTSGTVTFNQASPDIGGLFNYTGTSQAVAAAQYKDLTLSGTTPSFGAASFLVSGTFTSSAVPTFNSASTFTYNGAGSQTVLALNYGNLTSASSGARVLANSGTIGIAGTFTPGTNSYTITGSTVEFNGSSSQTIPDFDFNNLTSSSTGARVLVNGGTIGIAGTFTPGTNSYTITGNTVDFNGSSSQTIPDFDFNNLTSSSSGARVLVNGGTIGIAGTFTKGTNSYTVTGSTVEYNGSTTQTIAPLTYHHLSLTSGSPVTKSLGGAVTVDGDLTVSVNNTLDDAGFQITGNGSGTFTLAAGTTLTLGTAGTATLFPTNFITANIALDATSTVVYNSDQAQTIATAPVYGNLTLTATSSVTKTIGGAVTVATDLTIGANNILNVTGAGTVQINTGDLILNGTLSNSGTIDIGL
ncbi:MAG: hypothetical protein HUU02_11325 [Bacteroidetes bacterium]|nr:hypothetical protein [Bacteroidota bacterium]